MRMGTDRPVVEYQEGETFRSQAVIGGMLGMIMIAVCMFTFTSLVALQIYLRIYFHRVDYPIWLLAFRMVVILEMLWVFVYMLRILFKGFVRISNEGIECRKVKKISRVGWEEITAAEFTWRGRRVVGIRIHRGNVVKPLGLWTAFFGKESRARMEALIRERVPRELSVSVRGGGESEKRRERERGRGPSDLITGLFLGWERFGEVGWWFMVGEGRDAASVGEGGGV